jgi:hypothetical protein
MGRSEWRAAGVMAACLMVSACSSTSSDESAGRRIIDFLYYGGTTVPPSGPGLAAAVPCPAVTVAPGGAVINSYSGGAAGGPETLRSQLSITNVARECNPRPDGSIAVKVGVEGRALIGVAGAAGRFDAPLRFAVKRGEQVLASATRRATVALAAGETQGSFAVVEQGLVVPAGTEDFDIEVGLGGSAERPARRR